MGQQPLPGLGRGDAAAVADQQRLAQFDLERAHLTRQRRLRHLQHRCGAGEAAQLGHLGKVLQLLQIHAVML